MHIFFFASFQDVNPIENLWALLNHHVNKVAKPTTKDAHIAAIKNFWKTRVTPELCQKYIGHIQKVLPVVVEREGQATGY